MVGGGIALGETVQGTKEGKEEHSPQTPYKEKSKKPTTTTTRARARFVKPTVDEVTAHVWEKGYTFDPVRFWNHYESNGCKYFAGRKKLMSYFL